MVSVDYRLAPEHPYPQGLDDAWAALRWVSEHAADWAAILPDRGRRRLGGRQHLGVMTQMARDHGGPSLVFQLLWYPATTADTTPPSFTENAEAPNLDRHMVAAYMAWYLPDMDISNPPSADNSGAANTADLSGLPPAFIGTAEYDPLRDDGVRYAELLSAAGVSVELRNEPTLVHGYLDFAIAVPVAAEATNRGMAALKAALHPGCVSRPCSTCAPGRMGAMAGAQSRCGARSLAAAAQQERTRGRNFVQRGGRDRPVLRVDRQSHAQVRHRVAHPAVHSAQAAERVVEVNVERAQRPRCRPGAGGRVA